MTSIRTQTHQVVIGTARGLLLPGTGAVQVLDNTPITSVHADGDTLWILAGRQDLHRVSGDDSELVASLAEPAGACVGTHRGDVWIGGQRARLWRLKGSALEEVDSFQQVPTHEEWHTPWGGPPDVFSMASDGRQLYVSVHVGGILRSTDGESWTPTIDLHDDVHQVALGSDGTVWAATGRRGLAESTDQGATWRYHTAGLHARYALAVASIGGGALVAVSSGHAARDGVVYRFDHDGFRRCEGLPNDLGGAVGPRQIAAARDHAVVALPNGDVYTSDDGGRSWTRVVDKLPSVSEVALRAA